MKKVMILLAVVAVGLFYALPAEGTYYYTRWTNSAGDNDYHNDANWDTKIDNVPGYHLAPPETSDGNSWYVDMDKGGDDYALVTKGSYSWKFKCGYWKPAKVVLAEGDYTFHPGSFTIGESQPENQCQFIQHGGTVEGSPVIGRDNGNNPFGNGWGEYIIDGGTINGGKITVASNRANYGLFQIVGTSPTISISGYEQCPKGISKYGVESPGGWLKVILVGDGNGVSVIDCTNGSGEAVLSGTLHVDISQYTGDQTIIDIITAKSLVYKDHTKTYDPDASDDDPTQVPYPDLTLSDENIAAGFQLAERDNGDGTYTLQVVIPEPATLVLLGLGGCLTLLRRKK